MAKSQADIYAALERTATDFSVVRATKEKERATRALSETETARQSIELDRVSAPVAPRR